MRRSSRLAARRSNSRSRRRKGGCLPLWLMVGGLVSLLCLLALLLLQGAGGVQQVLAARTPSTTVLLLGVDRRSGESGPTRGDTMILAGLNPGTGRAALLSIPRDLWVPIPGIGEQRINTTLFFGHDANDPEAAPRLAKATVAQQFGLPVDRYLLLDFQTFVAIIDALGGVEVDVPGPITDTEYPTPDYGIQTIHFDAGPQVLDGARALVYVRTRHADSDFGRSARQQQVIGAVAAAMARPGNWLRLPKLYAVLRAGVQTDITAADWPALGQLVLAAADGQVEAATLEGDRTVDWVTPQGAWVQLPNWPAIYPVVVDLFGLR